MMQERQICLTKPKIFTFWPFTEQALCSNWIYVHWLWCLDLQLASAWSWYQCYFLLSLAIITWVWIRPGGGCGSIIAWGLFKAGICFLRKCYGHRAGATIPVFHFPSFSSLNRGSHVTSSASETLKELHLFRGKQPTLQLLKDPLLYLVSLQALNSWVWAK